MLFNTFFLQFGSDLPFGATLYNRQRPDGRLFNSQRFSST